MRKWIGLALGFGPLLVAGCGSSDSSTSATTVAEAAPPTTACPEGSRRALKGCVPIDTTTSTTSSPERAAFEAQYATMPKEMQLNFTGVSSDDVAIKICSDQAELTFVGLIGVEHYPDVARAGYVWKCPERVGEHDAAVLRAIAEDARRRAAPPTTAPAPTPPAPRSSGGVTVSQENAREKAASYLRYSSFSRSGLIDQLLYEGFSQGDATYGVDALGANWDEQAAKKAASYLEYSSFSRSGLIDQLLFEGFSQAQAEYGVSTTGL